MKVEINLYATLSKYLSGKSKQKSEILDIKDGARVRDIVKTLNIPAESIKLVFINGVHGTMDDVLKDGDRLGVFPPIGGG